MKLDITFDDVDMGYSDIIDAIAEIESMEANTGFFQENVDDGIALAELMAVHEFGSDARNIPERPAMRESYESNVDEIKEFMFKVGDKVIFEQNISADEAYLTIGDFYKSKFQNGIISRSLGLEANADSTIRKKGSDTPLIDTTRLVNGINTKVENK